MAISRDVELFISDYEAPLKKELSYIKENDWTTETSTYKREKKHKTNWLLVNRSVEKLVDFHKLAKEDLEYKKVKTFIDIILSFFTIYTDRYRLYIKTEDWTLYANIYGDDEEGQAKLAEAIENEVEFQSDLLKNINDVRKKLDKLNLEGETKKLVLPIHSDIPAPYLLRKKLIKMFPEIKTHMNSEK